MFDTTEHASQRVLRIRASWMQILERYSFTNGQGLMAGILGMVPLNSSPT